MTATVGSAPVPVALAPTPAHTPVKPPAQAGVANAKPAAPPLASGDFSERARALAQRPDVMALVVMRDELLARVAKQGETDMLATKSQLEELDRDLADARALQLKKDALQFQKLSSKPSARP